MKRGRVMLGVVGLVVVVVAAAVAGDEAADGFDPRTIPADERIAYVNRLLDCEPGPNAAKHYAAADKAHKYPFEVASYEDEDAQERAHWMGRNEWVLTLRTDWPEAYEETIAKWLKANEPALAALRKAAELERCCLLIPHAEAPLHQAQYSTLLRRLSKTLAVQAVALARQEQWQRAYEAHLRLHRIAAHLRQSPLELYQLVGAAVERLGNQQLLALVRQRAPDDLLALLQRIQAEREPECADEVEGKVTLLIEWDYVESQYQWAAAPDKYPKVGEIVESLIAMPETLAGIAGPDPSADDVAPIGKPPYADAAAYRVALQKSSVDASWEVNRALLALWRAYAKRPPHEALRDAESFARRRAALIDGDPVATLATWSMSGLRPLKQQFVLRCRLVADRAAVDTVLAAHAYRAQHDRWPTRLKELVPELLPAVPVDGFSGKPLLYRVHYTRDSFELYSVGPNQRDDGGEITEECDDIVYWPPQVPEFEPVSGD